MYKLIRKSAILIILAAILEFGNSGICRSQDWEDIIKAAKAIRTIKAEFTQTRQLRILATPLVSRGRIYYEAPDLLRWEYSSPIKQVMLKHGDNIRLYQFQEGAWKLDSSQTVEVRGMIFAEINRWLKGRFDKDSGFTPSYSSGTPCCIILTPSDEFKHFVNHIELIFSERLGIIQSVEIIESEEASIRIDFTHFDINSGIPAEIFEKP